MQVSIITPDDRLIAGMSREEAHRGEGVLHRAVSVFIVNSSGEFLLQKRSTLKPLWPNFWSNTCCGHPIPGESYELAAERRLKEELGITPPLRRLFRYRYAAPYPPHGSERELCEVYLGTWEEKGMPDPAEISDVEFLSPNSIDEIIKTERRSLTPWFLISWPTVNSVVHSIKYGDELYGKSYNTCLP